MTIKIEEIPKLINNEENRIKRIAEFLKEHKDNAYLEEELQKETGIECVHQLLNYRYNDLVNQMHLKKVDIIRKAQFGCGSDYYWFYQDPKPKSKGFWKGLLNLNR